MSDKAPSREEIQFLMNGDAHRNKLQYVLDQAVAGDQVVHILQIRNRVLVEWENLKFPDCEKNYVELLNNFVGNRMAKYKTNSERLLSRMKVACCKAKKKLQELQRRGSKKNRETFLNSWTKLSILRSDVMTVGDLEEENRRLQQKAQELEDKIEHLNYEIEEWKKKFDNLEKEKERLYQEMIEEVEREKISAKEEMKVMEKTNEAMIKYIRKLERNAEMHLRPSIKDITNLSKRQIDRRLQELGTRAQKALWFAKTFGLEPEVLRLSDSEGHAHSIDLKSKQSSPFPSPSESLLVAQSQIPPDSPPQTSQSTPDSTISTSEEADLHTPQKETGKNKQYETLSEADKEKVESVLYLMDKFSVGDAFIHELSMAVDGIPKSYLIRQCRNKLNSACSIMSTPGDAPGAQVSFKEALVNKLNILASIDSLSIMQYL